MNDRFDRQRALFGYEGQERIAGSRVAVVGAGGLGSFVLMELAYLGVGHITIIDHDRLERSNRNRLVGAWTSHPEGAPKVSICQQLIEQIDPSIAVVQIKAMFPHAEACEALEKADYVIGCVDSDGVRMGLNELVCRKNLRLVDAASDTLSDGGRLAYGGRICSVLPETGCLVCLQVLDLAQVQRELASPEQRRDAEDIYGITADALDEAGPSVASVNGVVASLAVTEFMVDVSGLRAPFAKLEYLGHQGIVLRSRDEGDPKCYFCSLRESGNSK